MPESRRPDGRLNDTGLIRPRRPCPRDFRETYIAMGWDGIVDHYRTNWRVIRRWIAEAGGDELRAARKAAVKAHGPRYLHAVAPESCPADNRRRRYVMGQTLTSQR